MTDEQRRDWVEVGATVLLAFAAVATAWSSYQATRWNGEQAKTSGASTRPGSWPLAPSGLANAQQQVDIATFMQWVDAYARDDDQGRALLPHTLPQGVHARVQRVGRDEAAEDQGRSGDAVRDAAVPAGRQGGRRPAGSEADELSAQVRRNIQRSSNYVLGVVLFAVALFFAGMSTKLTAPGLRKTMLVVGWLLFLGTAVWIATSPVSVAV